jgi:hypothetical protein
VEAHYQEDLSDELFESTAIFRQFCEIKHLRLPQSPARFRSPSNP